MTINSLSLSSRTISKIAGSGYLVIIFAGIFAEFFVRSSLIIPADPAATARNIIASESLFRAGIASDQIMLFFDALLAGLLYILLKPVNKNLALVTAFFRLVHSAIYGVNLLNLILVLPLLTGNSFTASFQPDQLYAIATLLLTGHNYGYVIGLAFFGIHCVLLGYLIIKSGYIPKILGLLLLIASAGYLIDSFAQILLIQYSEYAGIFLAIVAFPAIVAELSLALWLLVKGVQVEVK